MRQKHLMGVLVAVAGLAAVLQAADRTEIGFTDGKIFPESLTSTKNGASSLAASAMTASTERRRAPPRPRPGSSRRRPDYRQYSACSRTTARGCCGYARRRRADEAVRHWSEKPRSRPSVCRTPP